ncbi:hypothetical protein BVX95_00545, partial [archaeon D22]
MGEITLKKEFKEKLEEGYFHFNAIIEMVGKPKEHIEKTIKDYVSTLEKHELYILVDQNISEADETKDG